MSKQKIGAILLKGTPSQRAKLLSEEIARATYGRETLLTEKEFNSLQDSFKTSSEIKLYNKHRKTSRLIVDSIANLTAIKFEILMRYSDLRGYIVYWETIQQAELNINITLNSIKDVNERYKTALLGAEKINYSFVQPVIDEENFINLLCDFDINTFIDKSGRLTAIKNKSKIAKSKSLYFVLKSIKEDTDKSLINFISWRKATIDFMEEEGFNISTFKTVIEEITTDIRKPLINWAKYLTSEENFIPGSPEERLDKLKDFYNITPELEELEPDKDIIRVYREALFKKDE